MSSREGGASRRAAVLGLPFSLAGSPPRTASAGDRGGGRPTCSSKEGRGRGPNTVGLGVGGAGGGTCPPWVCYRGEGHAGPWADFWPRQLPDCRSQSGRRGWGQAGGQRGAPRGVSVPRPLAGRCSGAAGPRPALSAPLNPAEPSQPRGLRQLRRAPREAGVSMATLTSGTRGPARRLPPPPAGLAQPQPRSAAAGTPEALEPPPAS